jgi:lysylphosphatidylglycerol synthetase-like protein (DUF2156 family)
MAAVTDAAAAPQEEDFLTHLGEAHNQVMAALNFNLTDAWQQPGVISGVADFAKAVDWSEPVFLYLAAFHVAAWVLAFTVMNRTSNTQIAMLVLCVGAVLAAQFLNAWGAEYHKLIFVDDKVQYFDPSGIFISAVWSAPLLVLAFVLQVKLFLGAAVLMAKLKARELRGKPAQRAVEEAKGGKGGKGGKGKGKGKAAKKEE